MKIDILCVGKLKEEYLKEAVREYVKRLSRYCKPGIIEVADEKTSEELGEAYDKKVKKLEGERLKKHLKNDAFIITLEIKGERMTSEKFASVLYNAGLKGYSHVQFVIGGSLGLSDEITEMSDLHLSFSDMTFPHQMMRVILLEQIYRCFKINNNEPYHK